MRRDPTEFRERFKKWKAGAKVYLYGIPYEDDNHNIDYDQARANLLGYTPDNTGHLPTRDYETGRFLKSPAHPTVSMGVWGDMNMGYDVWYNNKDKSLYSQPNFTSTYKDRLPKFAMGTEGDIETLLKLKLIEKTDATTVQRQEPILPIKRNFIAEAQRKHAAEAVSPDTRSSYQRKQAQKAKQYANQQYQKAKDDIKRAEGLELMMRLTFPSTYVEAATGLDLGTVGRLATDVFAFGLPGIAKSVVKRGLKRLLPLQNISSAASENPYKLSSDTNSLFEKMTGLQIRHKLSQIKSTEPNELDRLMNIDDVIHHEGMPLGVEDVFRYLILPRTNINRLNYDDVINRLSRYGYNTLNDRKWVKYINDDTWGYIDNDTYGIALREGYLHRAAPHEFRHRMQKLIPDKPSLAIDRKSYLDRAYGDDFTNLSKNVDESHRLYKYRFLEDEKATTNLDARRFAFENFTDNPNIAKSSVTEQNEFLNSLTDDQIIDAVNNANGYGRAYIKFLDNKYHIYNDSKMRKKYASLFRDAMKYYGMYGAPTGIGYGMYNKYTNDN